MIPKDINPNVFDSVNSNAVTKILKKSITRKTVPRKFSMCVGKYCCIRPIMRATMAEGNNVIIFEYDLITIFSNSL